MELRKEAENYLKEYYAKLNPEPEPLPKNVQEAYSRLDKLLIGFPGEPKIPENFRSTGDLATMEKHDIAYKTTTKVGEYRRNLDNYLYVNCEEKDKGYIKNYMSLVEKYLHREGSDIKDYINSN